MYFDLSLFTTINYFQTFIAKNLPKGFNFVNILYKIQLVREIKSASHRTFVSCCLESMKKLKIFKNRIIINDEAHFYLNDYVNAQ